MLKRITFLKYVQSFVVRGAIMLFFIAAGTGLYLEKHKAETFLDAVKKSSREVSADSRTDTPTAAVQEQVPQAQTPPPEEQMPPQVQTPPQEQLPPQVQTPPLQEQEPPPQTLAKAQAEQYHPVGTAAAIIEANMNTPDQYSVGAGVYGMVTLPDWIKTGQFSAGFRMLYSYNPAYYHIFDAALLFRWNYDFTHTYPDAGIFIQCAGGLTLAWNRERSISEPFVFGLAQVHLGYRHSFKRWFIEPCIYAGYPTIWGIGISAGVRVDTKK